MGREISAFEGLELYDGRLSRTVLRGQRAARLLATRCVGIKRENMYFWKTASLAKDIKENKLSDNDCKQYYLAGAIFVSLSMYFLRVSPPGEAMIILIEAILAIGIMIFGVQATYNTNLASDGSNSNYVQRMVALSFPLSIKIFVLVIFFGVVLGVVNELASIETSVQTYIYSAFGVLVEVLIFWRLNSHLKSINT